MNLLIIKAHQVYKRMRSSIRCTCNRLQRPCRNARLAAMLPASEPKKKKIYRSFHMIGKLFLVEEYLEKHVKIQIFETMMTGCRYKKHWKSHKTEMRPMHNCVNACRFAFISLDNPNVTFVILIRLFLFYGHYQFFLLLARN